MIFPGRVTLVAGREKTGKSTLLSAVVAAYTREQQFLDDPPASGGDALWVNLEENDADLVQRLTAFNVDPDRCYLAGPSEIGDMDDIEREARRPGLGILVVDSLSKVAEREGIDEGGNAQKWGPLMSRLTQLARETGLAVVLIHHMNKEGGYRDSTSIGAGVDVIVEIDEGPPEDPTLRRLRSKGRIPVPSFSIRYNAGVPQFTSAGGELTPDAKAIAYVAAHPGTSMSAAVAGLGGRRDAVMGLLKTLLSRGILLNRGTDAKAALYVQGAAQTSEAESTEGARAPAGQTHVDPPKEPVPTFPGFEPREPVRELVPEQFPTGSAPVPAELTPKNGATSSRFRGLVPESGTGRKGETAPSAENLQDFEQTSEADSDLEEGEV